jgi:hypothetical protein
MTVMGFKKGQGPKTKKAKKPKRGSLATRATKLAQTLARLQETDEDGWGVCISCGQAVHYKEANGGHFQPKGRHYNGTCIDPENIHLQCVECNLSRGGNPAGYAKAMLKEYGEKKLEELQIKSKRIKLTAEDFMAYIEETAPLVRRLKNEKAFIL